MVGEQQAFETSVANAMSARQTMMQERLTAAFHQDNKKTEERPAKDTETPSKKQEANQHKTTTTPQSHLLTAQLIANEEISPMIGMDGVTPDFFKKK